MVQVLDLTEQTEITLKQNFEKKKVLHKGVAYLVNGVLSETKMKSQEKIGKKKTNPVSFKILF